MSRRTCKGAPSRHRILYYFVLHFANNHLKISHWYWILEKRPFGRRLLTGRNFSINDEKSGTGEQRFPVALPEI